MGPSEVLKLINEGLNIHYYSDSNSFETNHKANKLLIK